jgi:dolichol-phosphate mannosyltransferase
MRVLTAIPVYNEEAHIEEVLDAVLEHSGSVLVVDDGSRDGTPALLERYPSIKVERHAANRGYGAALRTAFDHAIRERYDAVVTLDCDGQHEPALIPTLIEALHEEGKPRREYDIVSGSRYLKVFDPRQSPPPERRKINREVTRWLNECLGFSLTDAFCGFKAYRTSALARLDLTVDGYAMPLELWVQAAALGLSIREVAVPLIYLDEKRAFGGALDDSEYRLKHYHEVFRAALIRSGLQLAGSFRE